MAYVFNGKSKESVYGEKEIVESVTKEKNNEKLRLDWSTICSRDMDVDSDRQKIRSLWNADMEKNGKDQLAW